MPEVGGRDLVFVSEVLDQEFSTSEASHERIDVTLVVVDYMIYDYIAVAVSAGLDEVEHPLPKLLITHVSRLPHFRSVVSH